MDQRWLHGRHQALQGRSCGKRHRLSDFIDKDNKIFPEHLKQPLENEVVGVPSPEPGSVQSRRRDGREKSAPRSRVTAKERTPEMNRGQKEVIKGH